MTVEQAKQIVAQSSVTNTVTKQQYLAALKVLAASAFSPR